MGKFKDLAIDIDIDIWGYGRSAAAAGRFTTQSLKAAYPYVELPMHWFMTHFGSAPAMKEFLDEHFPRNHNDQRVYMIWSSQFPAYIFFQSKEDADYCRVLFLMY